MAERKAPPGAGAKAKLKAGETSKPSKAFETAREYLVAVMNDKTIEAHRRDRAALALATMERQASGGGQDRGDGPVGKRAQAAEAAKVAAGGKFAPRRPPRLVVSNG